MHKFVLAVFTVLFVFFPVMAIADADLPKAIKADFPPYSNAKVVQAMEMPGNNIFTCTNSLIKTNNERKEIIDRYLK